MELHSAPSGGSFKYALEGGAITPIERVRGTAGTTRFSTRPAVGHRGAARIDGSLHPTLHGALGAGPVFFAWGPQGTMDLTALGAPGNFAYIGVGGGALLVAADARGIARLSIAVPNQPGLQGVGLSLQWAVIDGAANPLGLVTSAALDITVGF